MRQRTCGRRALQVSAPALDIAEILADLKLDQDSLIAAVLYRGVREGHIALPVVSQRFGVVVAKLIDGVARMAAISASLSPRQSMVMGTQGQVENLRKMLVAMVDDVRVALIKLAERTCAIRAVKTADDEKRNRVAREVFDIYAPLGASPGYRSHQVGAGGPVLPLPRTRPIQTDCHAAARAAARP